MAPGGSGSKSVAQETILYDSIHHWNGVAYHFLFVFLFMCAVWVQSVLELQHINFAWFDKKCFAIKIITHPMIMVAGHCHQSNKHVIYVMHQRHYSKAGLKWMPFDQYFLHIRHIFVGIMSSWRVKKDIILKVFCKSCGTLVFSLLSTCSCGTNSVVACGFINVIIFACFGGSINSL